MRLDRELTIYVININSHTKSDEITHILIIHLFSLVCDIEHTKIKSGFFKIIPRVF